MHILLDREYKSKTRFKKMISSTVYLLSVSSPCNGHVEMISKDVEPKKEFWSKESAW